MNFKDAIEAARNPSIEDSIRFLNEAKKVLFPMMRVVQFKELGKFGIWDTICQRFDIHNDVQAFSSWEQLKACFDADTLKKPEYLHESRAKDWKAYEALKPLVCPACNGPFARVEEDRTICSCGYRSS